MAFKVRARLVDTKMRPLRKGGRKPTKAKIVAERARMKEREKIGRALDRAAATEMRRAAIEKAARIERERKIREALPLTKVTVKDEMEKALGMSWANIYAEIENGNTELAVWCIEQLIGKPKQRSEVVGDVKHAHAHELVWRPERKLLVEESEMDKSDRLLDVLPREVVEAELVEVAK